ncbi:HD domain-containing phosphohydrolase [Deinococcus peraridilitoris]|uniref:HD domain-containing phosphohydrolase n=1 Tax=Deinococcus peraridilitoris TaxID=432329 RepID=UPI0002D85257|nr:HD domain-containing phosphohydrolase [Deinococcus peraridilitoris]
MLAEAAEALDRDSREAERLALAAREVAVTHDLLGEAAWALFVAGQAAWRQGAVMRATEAMESSFELFRVVGRWLDAARVQLSLGGWRSASEQYETAVEAAEMALVFAEQDGDPKVQAEALELLAHIRQRQDRSQDAWRLLERALTLYRSSGDVPTQVRCLGKLGDTLNALGDDAPALSHLLEAERLVREGQSDESCDDSSLKAALLIRLGGLYRKLGDLQRSQAALQEALTLSQGGQNRSHEMVSHETVATLELGQLQLALNAPEQAQVSLQRGLALARLHALRAQEFAALGGLGKLHALRGDLMEAAAAHREAAEVARGVTDAAGEASALLDLARVHLSLQQVHSAHGVLQRALALVGDPAWKTAPLEIHELLAHTCALLGDFQAALAHHRHFHVLDQQRFDGYTTRRASRLTDALELERARHDAEVYRLRTEAARQARAEAEGQVRDRTLELEHSQLEAFTRLALAGEYRDDETGQHTWRVGQYTASIARAMGLPDEQVDLLGVAARLHDVGKIGIPDAILLKPGKFTPEEYERMKTHTIIGARLLSGSRSTLLQLAEVIAWTHHERWDGQGYPHGLADEAIPLPGRIVAVADVFDALTHARTYKPAWTHQAALDELMKQKGAQFDPQVVEAALGVFSTSGFFEGLERDQTAQQSSLARGAARPPGAARPESR